MRVIADHMLFIILSFASSIRLFGISIRKFVAGVVFGFELDWMRDHLNLRQREFWWVQRGGSYTFWLWQQHKNSKWQYYVFDSMHLNILAGLGFVSISMLYFSFFNVEKQIHFSNIKEKLLPYLIVTNNKTFCTFLCSLQYGGFRCIPPILKMALVGIAS